MLAIGSICLLLSAPIHAAAGGPGTGQSGVDQRTNRSVTAAGAPDGRSGGVTFTPLTADVRTTGQAGTSVERLSRDSQGRTRLESASTVTISDPATKTTLRLDKASRTFQRTVGGATDASRPDTVQQGQLSSAPRALGTATVRGVKAEGRAYTVTTPARKGSPAQVREVIMWLSTEVQLAVDTRITGAAGVEFAQSYTNIRTGAEPAAGLFTVPAGYREAGSASRATPHAPCPLNNAPDPLVLNSYDFLWGAGYVTATTDPQLGCIFVADGAYFEYPIWGGPTTAIGLPYDQWYVFDTGGGGLPYLPWVAFGDVAFMVSNGSDTTTKDSLVVLTVWCC